MGMRRQVVRGQLYTLVTHELPHLSRGESLAIAHAYNLSAAQIGYAEIVSPVTAESGAEQ